MTILARVVERLTAAGTGTIIEYRDGRLDGRVLLERIGRRARGLGAAGLRRGETLSIVASDNVTAFEQLVAAWMCGAGACLLDFRSPAWRLADMEGRLGAAMRAAPRAADGGDASLCRPGQGAAAPFAPGPDADDPVALWQTSSGSTGKQSLFPVGQARLARRIDAAIASMGMPDWGASAVALPLAYSAGVTQWFAALLHGRPIVALDPVFRLTELDQVLRRRDVSETALPPPLIRRLAALEGARPRYPHLAKLVSVGGPATPEDKVAAVRNLTPRYRMTYSAAGVGAITRILGDEVLQRPASCGRAAPGVDLTIRAGGRICAPGEPGEVFVRPADGPVARPGDLGWMDAEGYLYITGRVQGMLSRNGVNFTAEQLVGAALSLAEVRHAAVAICPGPDRDDQVILVVEAPAALRVVLEDRLRLRLPAAERPDRIIIVDHIPLNAAGKTDQAEVEALVASQLTRGEA